MSKTKLIFFSLKYMLHFGDWHHPLLYHPRYKSENKSDALFNLPSFNQVSILSILASQSLPIISPSPSPSPYLNSIFIISSLGFYYSTPTNQLLLPHCSQKALSKLFRGRKIVFTYLQFSSVQFSRSVVSDSLQPHELQHTRLPCPSPTPRVHSNSRPSSW